MNDVLKPDTAISTQPPLEYSNDAWNLLVDHATVNGEGAITVTLKDDARVGLVE